MDGFLDGKPVMAKVSWVADEVPLLNGKPTEYGLLAEVPAGDGIDRYFVPWTSVTYLKQSISAAESGGVKPPPGQSRSVTPPNNGGERPPT